MNERDLDRFMANVVAQPDGCWHWDGPVKAGGYGNAWVDEKSVLAHRASYEHFIGPIPDGLVIDHLCCTKPCVHPLHLEAVTHRENSRRALFLGLTTPCKRGHPLAALHLRKTGSRVCRECEGEQKRAKRAAVRRAAGRTILFGRQPTIACPRGHLQAEHRYPASSRCQGCRTCSLDRSRARRQQQKEKESVSS